MLGGVIGLMEGDKDIFRTWRILPLALEVFGEEETVMELVFCRDGWAAFCGGEESRPILLRGFKGKVSIGPKEMVRC